MRLCTCWGENMDYKRYGRVPFLDLLTSWAAIVILLFFAIVGFLLDLPSVLCFFPIIFSICWFFKILIPFLETFSIRGNIISTFFLGKKKTIALPSKPTIIIGYADICPPLSHKTPTGNETHIIRNTYSVSILENVELEFVIEALHRNNVQKYTASMIRTIFWGSTFIYDFFDCGCVINKLLSSRTCYVVIPKSLQDTVNLDSNKHIIFIDQAA